MSRERTILVVEDDLDIRETLIDALEMEGYTTVGAIDGLDALERLRAMPTLPGLILLDLMMPRMNGMQFCQEKQAIPEWSTIPIVILSADARAKERAATCGAASCLHKPIDLDSLFATVARVLGEAAA